MIALRLVILNEKTNKTTRRGAKPFLFGQKTTGQVAYLVYGQDDFVNFKLIGPGSATSGA